MKRRQRAVGDDGDDNPEFDVGREVVEVDVGESYVNDCFKETLEVLLLILRMVTVIL